MIRYTLLKIISKGICPCPPTAAFFIEPQEDYLRLGRDPGERQATYRDLFCGSVGIFTLTNSDPELPPNFPEA